jgi:phage regulator Rha-like protein
MNSIIISERNKVLVVDSRIVAQGLSIEHKSLLKTIKRYESLVETNFGKLNREVSDTNLGNGRIRQDVDNYWLTEDQATFLMTLSRNSDPVVQCKVNLVKAFSEAKKKLQQPIKLPKQQLEDLTEVQLKGLVIFAGCSKNADRELDKSELLKGIDPIFWNLSVNACMALLKQRQLQDLLFLEPLNLLTVELEHKDDLDQFKLLATKQMILRDTKRLRDAVNNETLVKALEVAKLTLPESYIREPIVLAASSNPKGFGKPKK